MTSLEFRYEIGERQPDAWNKGWFANIRSQMIPDSEIRSPEIYAQLPCGRCPVSSYCNKLHTEGLSCYFQAKLQAETSQGLDFFLKHASCVNKCS